jgi:formylglycine-generating enzyme required for sulfatase activity
MGEPLRPALLAGVVASLAVNGCQAAAGDVLRDCVQCPDMIEIPAGSYTMGSPPGTPEMNLTGRSRAESPSVTITISRAFALGRTEITRGQYAAFVDATGYDPAVPFCRVWDAPKQRFFDASGVTWRDGGIGRQLPDDVPVTCVSWPDAVAYTRWLSEVTGEIYRLPSEAEWEYAARAGTTTRRPWGDASGDGCHQANSYDLTAREQYPLAWQHVACRDGFADLAPAGSLQPNGFGLHDMIGNVWEWVADCFTTSKIGRPKDQRPWVWQDCGDRALRGGGWITGPERSRSAYPAGDPPDDRYNFLGFRVARELTSP